jgi:hypothetical protein
VDYISTLILRGENMWFLILLGSIGIDTKVYSLLDVPTYGYLQIVSEKQPNLSLSVSETNKNNEVSSWKKLRIYGFEFVVGYGVSAGWWILVNLGMAQDEHYPHEYKRTYITYLTIGNILLTAPTVWGIGKLLKQEGTLWKSMLGAGIGGTILGILDLYWLPRYYDSSLFTPLVLLILSIPPLGAVIGYNL